MVVGLRVNPRLPGGAGTWSNVRVTSREKRQPHRIAVLASGVGSNMVALADAAAAGKIPGSIELVLSDVPGAPVLQRASERGIEARHLDPGRSRHRLDGEAEAAYIRELRGRGITLVCLAGFMRILHPAFLEAFSNSILNVHPSLLPAFPGLDAVGQALAFGARVTGATVHFVWPAVDAGPVVLQEAVPVREGDTHETLAARVHDVEHRIYPRAAALFCEGRLSVEGRHVRILS
ncbi:MAG: phosphoribosylglycinamide formyltransferase [Candidatus Eisenbacteria bacterium]|nr:phosphoribosylglycinamide formyltransferase [Candidatus Eisenbacteria bacterium]